MSALTRRWVAALGAFATVALVVTLVAGFVLQRRLAALGSNDAAALWSWLLVMWAATVGMAALAVVWAQRALSNALEAMFATVQGGSARARSASAEDSVFAGIAGSVQRMAEELDRAMTSLASERNRFEAVLETMAPAVLALDARRRITTANRSARALFDIPEIWENTELVEVVRLPALHAFLDAVFEGGPSEIEVELPGTQRHIRARASRLGDGGVVVVADDTTEIRRLERVRRDFVANVSHELRTPIAVIRANAETLLDGAMESPQVAEPFVAALFRHADRLGRLITELLDISALEAGKRVLSDEEFELRELVEDVVAAHGQAANDRQIRLGHHVGPDVWVCGDPKATEQILVNLVDNAIKYGRPGGEVEISVVAGSLENRIEVRDDGPGIEPQHRARIFERFYRVDSGRSRDAGGTGLGLSIAKDLAEAMGGNIGVEPRSPHGSTFWFSLVRCSSAEQAQAPGSELAPVVAPLPN